MYRNPEDTAQRLLELEELKKFLEKYPYHFKIEESESSFDGGKPTFIEIKASGVYLDRKLKMKFGASELVSKQALEITGAGTDLISMNREYAVCTLVRGMLNYVFGEK